MTHPIVTSAMTTQPSASSEDMSYVIQTEESFEEGVRRIVEEQVQKAIGFLNDGTDVHAGVHNARRCLKIVRAAWRLIREDLPADDFDRKNAFYRDAGARLSELRDLTALLETLAMLQRNNPRMRRWVSKRLFQRILEEKRTETPADVLAQHPPRQVAAELAGRYEEVNAFQLSENYPDNVLASLQKVYGRGRQAHLDCKDDPDPERMHDWRKRAKYLRYHLHMLRQAWPAVFAVVEKEFHLLTDYLGDFNNLTVMKKHLADPEYPLKDAYRETLLREADQCQVRLWRLSIHLGDRLFAEQPEAFAGRMGVYLADLLA